MPTPAALLLPPNPVWRSYVGGQVLREFRGQAATADDHFPEDWLASTVRARNGDNSQHELEGLSRVAGGGVTSPLATVLEQAPAFWFGPAAKSRPVPGVLWKLLDAAGRLQLQAHPDRAFARRHLGSDAGKTECWYILATRGPACVYLGFQRPPSRQEWGRMIREQDVSGMLACFEPIEVKPGECYVVPAGTPHAIGAGVFMLELQEPTDWVVRCETNNAGLRLPPEACFMGLDLDRCLDVFDYRERSVAEVRNIFQQQPRRLRQTDSFAEDEITSPAWHEFFRLHRLHGTGSAEWPGNELILLIALKGHGELSTGAETQAVRAGQTWLLPGAARNWEWRNTTGDWECLLAKIPAAAKTTTNLREPEVTTAR